MQRVDVVEGLLGVAEETQRRLQHGFWTCGQNETFTKRSDGEVGSSWFLLDYIKEIIQKLNQQTKLLKVQPLMSLSGII